jgi:hypothetical protein
MREFGRYRGTTDIDEARTNQARLRVRVLVDRLLTQMRHYPEQDNLIQPLRTRCR